MPQLRVVASDTYRIQAMEKEKDQFQKLEEIGRLASALGKAIEAFTKEIKNETKKGTRKASYGKTRRS